MISAVIVWYKPQEMHSPTASEAILTYASFFSKIYIIDNSDNDNSEIAKLIPNAIYIPNRSNLGIAAALNIGCAQALKDGFEWCMTMDQDSFFDTNEITRYILFDFIVFSPRTFVIWHLQIFILMILTRQIKN